MFKWTGGWVWVRRAIALWTVQVVFIVAVLVGAVILLMRWLGFQ